MTSYPGLEPVRDALKNAHLESGFAFWDLYEAMGGHNSMPSFVHSDPPLASTDYIHFSQPGNEPGGGDVLQCPDAGISASINQKMEILSQILTDIFLFNPEKPLIFTGLFFWGFYWWYC